MDKRKAGLGHTRLGTDGGWYEREITDGRQGQIG